MTEATKDIAPERPGDSVKMSLAYECWLRIKDNLSDRSIYHEGMIDDETIDEIDEEQAAVIDECLVHYVAALSKAQPT